MILLHRAAKVLPISSGPIADGWVAVADGLIVAVGDSSTLPPAGAVDVPSSSRRVVLPGLVNAHVHLELSWMRGQVAPGGSMPEWASRLIALRRGSGGDAVEPIREAIASARATGTTLVGDITNSLAAIEPLRESPMSAMVFREMLGFNVTEPETVLAPARAQLDALPASDRLRVTLAPHAPYSVSPQLLRALGQEAGPSPISIHLGESAEESEFLHGGTGAWRTVLERVGVWDPEWVPPACSPVEYMDRVGLLSSRLVAVHGVQLADSDLATLRDAGATLVTCPRSNRWTAAGDAPVDRFYASGVEVAIGTDSLASVDTLDLFDEIRLVRKLAPAVAAARILRSATLAGARALGFGSELGSIEPGKRAELLAIELPADVVDVEEYLVGDAPKPSLVWLDSGASSAA